MLTLPRISSRLVRPRPFACLLSLAQPLVEKLKFIRCNTNSLVHLQWGSVCSEQCAV